MLIVNAGERRLRGYGVIDHYRGSQRQLQPLQSLCSVIRSSSCMLI